MQSLLARFWYQWHPLRWLLYPLSCIFMLMVALRRWYLSRFKQQAFNVPVIVVGNLTVGGVGKTPLVIALAQACRARGLRVGIVSRGFGAACRVFPHEVILTDEASFVGDEPLLIAQKTQCPVVIAPDRVAAVNHLLQQHACQIIISDDGLQHYRMGRAVEIVVVDGLRGLGNQLCLPAGPLREPVKRMKQVDFVMVNGATWPQSYRMDCVPGHFCRLRDKQPIEPTQLQGTMAAVAGIGHPQRFFNLLTALGFTFNPYPLVDHHRFVRDDLELAEDIIVMTEKDAVKCAPFATDKMVVLPIEAQVPVSFWQAFWTHPKLQGLA